MIDAKIEDEKNEDALGFSIPDKENIVKERLNRFNISDKNDIVLTREEMQRLIRLEDKKAEIELREKQKALEYELAKDSEKHHGDVKSGHGGPGFPEHHQDESVFEDDRPLNAHQHPGDLKKGHKGPGLPHHDVEFKLDVDRKAAESHHKENENSLPNVPKHDIDKEKQLSKKMPFISELDELLIQQNIMDAKVRDMVKIGMRQQLFPQLNLIKNTVEKKKSEKILQNIYISGKEFHKILDNVIQGEATKTNESHLTSIKSNAEKHELQSEKSHGETPRTLLQWLSSFIKFHGSTIVHDEQ